MVPDATADAAASTPRRLSQPQRVLRDRHRAVFTAFASLSSEWPHSLPSSGLRPLGPPQRPELSAFLRTVLVAGDRIPAQAAKARREVSASSAGKGVRVSQD